MYDRPDRTGTSRDSSTRHPRFDPVNRTRKLIRSPDSGTRLPWKTVLLGVLYYSSYLDDKYRRARGGKLVAKCMYPPLPAGAQEYLHGRSIYRMLRPHPSLRHSAFLSPVPIARKLKYISGEAWPILLPNSIQLQPQRLFVAVASRRIVRPNVDEMLSWFCNGDVGWFGSFVYFYWRIVRYCALCLVKKFRDIFVKYGEIAVGEKFDSYYETLVFLLPMQHILSW